MPPTRPSASLAHLFGIAKLSALIVDADVPVAQVAGDTVTYSGTLVTTSAPSGSTPGTAVLVAKTCSFTSDGATCRLTGTETFTSAGGTITTDSAGDADRVVTFTDTFTAATSTTGTGSGTGQGTISLTNPTP